VAGFIVLCLAGWLLLSGSAHAQGSKPALPPAPRQHVEDAAGMLSPAARGRILRKLEEFEKSDGSQVVLWTSPSIPSGTTLEEHVHRVFQEWKIGRKGRDNGVLFAVFRDERKMRIEVGYGLEGPLPDATAGRIISQTVAPKMRSGEVDAALEAGIDAVIAATRGEYKATNPQGGRDPRKILGWGKLAAIAGAALGGLARLAFWRPLRIGSVLGGVVIGAAGHFFALLFGAMSNPAMGGFVLLFVWIALLVRQTGSQFSRTGHHSWGVNHWGSVQHLIKGQAAIVDLLGKPVDSVKLSVQVGGCTMGSGSTNDFADWH
jgi:uncharacterized protein